jgi:hypothetical protein
VSVIHAVRTARYSRRTISKSYSAEVAAAWLSNVEPARAPVTIKRLFDNVKPMPAAAHPEHEFSIEMTTGKSAPPIGASPQPEVAYESLVAASAANLQPHFF